MYSYFFTYNAIFDAPVSGNAKLAYAYLCKCADADGKCYPSHKAIAAAAGACVTTVKKALAELEGAGLITIRGQARPDRGRRANIYTVVKEAVKGFFVTYGNMFMQTLTSKARLVYLYFCRLASGRGQAFPSHSTTAAACGLSVSGTRLAIDELEAAGLISREAQYRGNGGQRANLYTLAEPKNADGSHELVENDTQETESRGNGTDGAGLIESENLVGLHAERAGDSVDSNDGQTVDNGTLQMADCGVAQIGFLSQFKLAHTLFFSEKLNLEPDVFKKLVFFLRVGLSANRHFIPSLREIFNALMNILKGKGLHYDEAEGYNKVVKLQYEDIRGKPRLKTPFIMQRRAYSHDVTAGADAI